MSNFLIRLKKSLSKFGLYFSTKFQVNIFTATAPLFSLTKLLGMNPYTLKYKTSIKCSVFAKVYSFVSLLAMVTYNSALLKTKISHIWCRECNKIAPVKKLVDIIDMFSVILTGLFSYTIMIKDGHNHRSILGDIHQINKLLEVDPEINKKELLYSLIQACGTTIYCLPLFYIDFGILQAEDERGANLAYFGYYLLQYTSILVELQFVSLCLIVRKRFRILNKKLNDIYKHYAINNGCRNMAVQHFLSVLRFRGELKQQSSLDKLKLLGKIHYCLCRNIERIEFFFGAPLLGNLTQLFVAFVLSFYLSTTSIIQGSGIATKVLVINIAWIIMHILRFFLICYCAKVTTEEVSSKNFIWQLINRNKFILWEPW